MKKIIAIFFILLFFFMYCGKKAEKVNSDFIGSWVYISSGGASRWTMKITDGKDSQFETCEKDPGYVLCGGDPNCYKCTVNSEGVARIKKGYLHIGINKYKIDAEPTMGVNGKKYIVVDGKTYTNDDGGNCYDGIKNQNETDIDCGGVCSACATCDDGIKNKDETAIDCGGSKCDSCYTSFSYAVSDPLGGGGNSSYNAQEVDALYGNGMFTIQIDKPSTYQNLTLEFNASLPGTYNLTVNSYVRPGSSYGNYYYDSGSITITSFDQTTRKITGTFQFTGKDNGAMSPPVNPYCYVSNGKFINLKYHQ